MPKLPASKTPARKPAPARKAKAKVSAPARIAEVPPAVRGGLQGLHALSLALAETARRHVDRLQREIAEIGEVVPSLNAKELAKLAKLLAALQIKPHKGRRKDLKKIDLLIGELEQLVGK
jgi:hypothetical protein